MTTLKLRIDFDVGRALGPGKIRLLELIGETGSISGAARSLGMSYRRAWLLVDAVNQTFERPAVTTREGGAGGGGATLTAFGRELAENYRAMEREAFAALSERLASMEQALSRKCPPSCAG